MGWPFKNILNIGKALEKAAPTVIKTSEALPVAVKSITAAQPVVSTVKPVIQAYQIQHLPGYQLKSLMRGNPLEKQLSKTGTISTASIDALSKKMSAVEQAVIGKVLPEKFSGQKAIDYNDFRKGVQDELITYDRTPVKDWENYGLERLYRDPAGISAGWYGWAEPKAFMFSSSRIPRGNSRHYEPNTLGHFRTFTTTTEPNVLHILESQSDAAQSGRKVYDNHLTEYLNDPKNLQAFIDSHKNLLKQMEENPSEYIPGSIEEQRTRIDKAERALSAILADTDSNDEAQIKYLMDTYQTHQLQEILRYAAEKGYTKMRYPTSETAATIENFTKVIDKEWLNNPEIRQHYSKLKDELQNEQQAILKKYAPVGYIDPADREIDWDTFLPSEQQEEIAQRIQMSDAFDDSLQGQKMRNKLILLSKTLNPDQWLLQNGPKVYSEDQKTILKKYDIFPKQFNKLFRNASVRTTQDLHGNTWYEVDVPKDYLQMEWPYKEGGSIPSIFKDGGILKAQKGKIIKAIGEAVKSSSKPALVKYYAPTMGKTFAAKSNPLLVDFDDIIREPSRQILNTYGFKSKSDMYNSGNTDAISAYEKMLIEKLNGLRTNPQYNGKTIVVSPTAVANPDKIGFRYDNVPSIPVKSVFIERNVGRGGTPGASEMWYNSLMRQYPEFNIENRFVSELEPMPTDEQWDALYNAAIESGNMDEVQRLRDMHFSAKASDNKLVNQNGVPHKVWHGSPEEWTIFDNSKRGLEDVIYFSTDKSYADQFTIPKKKWKLRMIPTKSSRPFYLYGKTPLNIGSDMESDLVQNELMRNWMNGGNADSVYGLDLWTPDMPLKQSNGMEFGVLRRNQMKLADPIAFDDNGNIISLSKRDDFTNPDIRYGIIPLVGLGLGAAATQKEKNGGTIKSIFDETQNN